jgi:hypothetical protein
METEIRVDVKSEVCINLPPNSRNAFFYIVYSVYYTSVPKIIWNCGIL